MNPIFKRLTSAAAALAVCLSAGGASAAAIRTRYGREKGTSAASHEGDVYFQDFTGTDEGELPAEILTGGSGGYVSTEESQTAKKVKKNCLKLVDTDYGAAYNGPSAAISFANQTGLVGMQTRFKYTAEGGCTHSSFNIELRADSNAATRLSCSSSGGNFGIQASGATVNLDTGRVASDVWYTLTYVVDLGLMRADAILLNEGTGESFTALDVPFYATSEIPYINQVFYISQYYGGTWTVDYLRIYKADERIEIEIPDGAKGVEAEKIASPVSHAVDERINIKVNGKYKYTTALPYEKDGQVMANAKNLAVFLGMSYYRVGNSYTLAGNGHTLVLQKDSGMLTADGKDTALSVSSEAKGYQLFVPVQDICMALDYKYEFDREESTVYIGESGEEEQK